MILNGQHPITGRSVALPRCRDSALTGTCQCNGTRLSNAALAAVTSAPGPPGWPLVQACPVPPWRPPRIRGRPVRSKCSPPCSHRTQPPPPTKTILYVVGGGGCPPVRASPSTLFCVRLAPGGIPAPASLRSQRHGPAWPLNQSRGKLGTWMAGPRGPGVALVKPLPAGGQYHGPD
jgi:hypothetical protein